MSERNHLRTFTLADGPAARARPDRLRGRDGGGRRVRATGLDGSDQSDEFDKSDGRDDSVGRR